MCARRIALAFAVLLLSTAALNAQTILPCEVTGTSSNSTSVSISLTCTEGGQISIDFGAGLADAQSAFAGTGITFSYSFQVGGNLPPGTTFSPSGLFSGTLAAAGTFSLTITYTFTFTFNDGTTQPFTESIPETLIFTVNPGTGPATSVDPKGLSFSLTQGAAPASQTVTISNHSAQVDTFSASASVNSGANWLSVSPGAGTIPSFGSGTLSIVADPSKLQPGTYSGTVTISVGGQSFTVSVLVTVASSQPNILLSETGLRFQAVTGGSATSPQTVTVLNSGAGTLNFNVKASTISGGNWLSVSPSSGTSGGSSTGSATFSVNAAALAPGDYYGQATFTASGAANSPQVVSVVLNVLSPANSPGAFVQPSGLIFVGSAGGTNPAAKTLSITNPSPNPLTFLGTAFTTNASNWLTFTPASGTVSANQPASVSIQPILQGLAPGVYTADFVLNIVPSSTSPTTTLPQTLHIEVLLVVLPAGSSSVVPAERSAEPHATGCTPTKLVPVFTQLATGFATAAAWPTEIEVTVVDDCGTPLTTGSVSATFSDGDPALSLASLKDGRWSATWEPGNKTTAVTVTAQAQEAQPPLKGSQMIGGALSANPVAPAVNTGGVLSAASYIANQPLAPGSFAAIFGTNLSPGVNQSLKLPLSNQLGGTSVVIGGEQVPLLFTSSGQINAVVPYDLPVNSTQQLVVQMGSAISIPQPIVIAPAQPAVFTTNAAGTGPAIIQVYKPDRTPLPYGSSVSGGYVIVIYCAGLGAVNPPVAVGTAAPLAPLSNTVNPVTVTIGGMSAQVLFAGLTPNFAQLYQVNVVVPSGLPSGNATLLLNVGGQQSAPVTIPMQ